MAFYENFGNRRKGKHVSDLYKLDIKNKTPEENIKDIIRGLYLEPFPNDLSPTNKHMESGRLGFKGSTRSGLESRKLAYLNALVTLLAKEDRNNLGFTQDELMTCIRVSLVDDSMVVRAAALRVLRYLIKSENDVATFNNLKLPYLVIRSMDLMLRNEEERASALRVVRRVVAAVGAASTGTGLGGTRRAAGVEPGLLRCLTAVARAGSAPDAAPDRLSRPAIATLAEICVLNPEMFIACGGVSAVTRQLAECATPRMAEALCGVLLHALNDPVSRRSARIDLMCLNSPYCDFHFRPTGTESSRDEREMRFTCSRLALLCVLRSWPGLLHFCHPYSTGGLRALVAALYLPRLEVRKAILDLLYELVGLPQPEWTDEISVALNAVDPSDFQDSWRLNEGFVAEEGIAVLPHLGATGPDITEIHLALLLQCFFEAGLLDGLAEVIVTSDTFISVRATVLLGQLLQLMHALLPARSVAAGGAGLAALAGAAAAGRPAASAAVEALRRLHAVRAARPASASLFLDHVVQCCAGTFARLDRAARSGVGDVTDDAPDADKSRKERDNADMARLADPPSDEEPPAPRARSLSFQRVAKSAKFFVLFGRDSDTLIKSTLVMQNKDGNTWNWEIIRTILKENDSAVILNLNDSSHKAWAARIMNYLRPSSNKYSHTDLSSSCHGHAATRAGCQLIRHLLKHNDIDSRRLLEEFFNDVSRQIEAIETGLKAHECLFSPQHMCNTMCQMYFLFIGQLCHSQTGLKIFKQTKLYENLLELSTKTHHSCYVKLVISSLDYSLDSFPRDILAKTLTCSIQSSRLYTTQFLNVLLRATRKSRELVRRKSKLKRNPEYAKSYKDDNYSCGDDMETWILQLLVGQIKDECKEIVKIALTILEEGFSVPVFFEKMMPLKNSLGLNCGLDSSAEPSSLDLSSVGDRGYLLWLSLEVASAANSTDPKSLAFLKKHLDFWTKTYNYRYVRVVEGLVHGALTLSACGGGGRGAPRWRRSARPPPHLHAALARAPPARARALLAPALHEHYKILQRKKCSNEQEIVELKASLWAVGNTAVTAQGLQLLMNLSSGYLEESVVVHIVRLTKYSPVYAVRATAFYVLSLIGTTYDGANLLADLGWVCVRHTRHDQFPVIPDECYSLFEGGAGGGAVEKVTSPDRFAYEAEASEHSDHTDQSTAESLPSDHVRPTKAIPTDQDVVDHRLCPEKKDQDKRKSHTLPSQGCSTGPDRSMLSESRTVDILRDCSSYERPPRPPLETRLLIGRMNSLEHAPEGRVRNTSESSTSGVSSCDSFLGKYQIPDRVLTLSPIPSSSSLYGMKSSNSTQRPKVAELQRRTSTSSFAGHEVASSPPSQMDMTGYATLKSINRRPHLSESAATGPGTATGSSEVDDLSWLLADSNRRQKPFSSLRDRTKSTRERINKLSLLEYDWKPVGGVGARASPEPRRRPTPALRAPAPHDTTTYMGICLPKDLMDIFPRDEERKEDEIDKGDQLKRGRLPSFLDASLASNEKSRSTPDSQKLSYSRGLNTTSSTNVRPFIVSSTPNAKSKSEGRTGSKSDVSSVSDGKINLKPKPTEIDETNDKSDDTIKNDTSGSDVTKTEDNVKVNENDRIPVTDSEKNVANNVVNKEVWRHAPADCLVCVRTRPPSSHELREAFLTGIDPTEPRSSISSPTHEKTSPQAQLLHQVHFMSNPIHIRQTRQVLLSLKQRHPDVFRSACVYSDVCALLSRDTYLLCARRFIQELFLDTSFDSFAVEPANILARHK